MTPLLKNSLLIVLFLPFLSGCFSTLIDTPGIEGRFVEEASGKPISGVKVVYTSAGSPRTEEIFTDKQGYFHFKPTFQHWQFTCFPGSFLSLRTRLELRLREKRNFASTYGWVYQTDIKHATIQAGVIKVNRVFLMP